MASKKPTANRPVFSTPTPNANVVLYEGPLGYKGAKGDLQGPGSIRLVWSPTSRMEFSIGPVAGHCLVEHGEGELTLDDSGTVVKVRTSGSGFQATEGEFSSTLRGFVSNDAAGPDNLEHVVFHLPNFPAFHGLWVAYPDVGQNKAARVELEAVGWCLAIDADSDLEETLKALRAEGGNAITHVGRLWRKDGTTFTAGEAIELLADLTWYISFALGRWCAPILVTGFRGNKEVWRSLELSRFSDWRTVNSWWDSDNMGPFVDMFPEFQETLHDATWKPGLVGAVHWYVEANSTTFVENAIVLAQVGLELLSWVLLVGEGRMTKSDFDKLNAAKRFRAILQLAGVPEAIPSALAELAAEANAQGWADGPQALTWFRNSIAHATRLDKVLKAPKRARYEVKQLGLWYMEMLVLWRLGYKGPYRSRLSPLQGTARPPWAP